MSKLLQLIPFFLFSQTLDCGKPPKIDFRRVIEGLIIAAVAGVIAGIISVNKLEVKVDAIPPLISALEQRVCEENRRQEARIDKQERRLDIHIERAGVK